MAIEQKFYAAGKNIAFIALLLSVAGLMLFRTFFDTPPETTVKVYQCADLMQGCKVRLNGKSLEIMFSGTPGALRPFALSVKTDDLKEVSASFTMVGMEMGANRYQLISNGSVWEAKVMLPVCVTGRRDWILTLSLDKNRIQIPFSA